MPTNTSRCGILIPNTTWYVPTFSVLCYWRKVAHSLVDIQTTNAKNPTTDTTAIDVANASGQLISPPLRDTIAHTLQLLLETLSEVYLGFASLRVQLIAGVSR